MDKNLALAKIKTLISNYQEVVKEGRISKYNEEMTKKDFILPLFETLGWKTSDSREVSAEEKISKKRVDYGFRINGIPKFFLEAKSFKEDLDDRKYIEQAINYSWHKGCTWAILTNFESIKIFNAEVKTEHPWLSQFKPTLHCIEFVAKFDELLLLSRESFEMGLLDREAEKWGKKAKKTAIDKQLLDDFTHFRDILNRNIIKLNGQKKISQEELDEAVQRILDRLIFIRNCEDRELEPKTLISNYREWESKGRGHLIKSLRDTFAHFDEEYNSKIFAEHLCDDLDIDNEVLHEVIEGLYHTREGDPYDFSIIDADVLGTIYEQYLGHILKKTEKRTILTENHAHRKEEGIFYTPPFIVKYIVRNTLGELLKDKKIDAESIRLLDPACGSGSFLIKAFDVLNEYYKENDKNYKQTQLDLEIGIPFKTKSRILQNNIFGVDLDRQAIEIAQLNLLLKIAEKGHRLPILERNIRIGNSLIDDETIAGSKAFKWEEKFKDIMESGGFDVIIGNPPYIRIQTMKEDEKSYLIEKYVSAKGKFDLYILFIERALSLLKENGLFSFIIPNKFTQTKYGENLKEFILKNFTIIKFIDFGDLKVFGEVTTYPCIMVIKKRKPSSNSKGIYVKVKALTKDIENRIIEHQTLENFEDDTIKVFKFRQNTLGAELWSFMSSDMQDIFDKINNSSSTRLIDLRERIYEGFISGNNSAFFMNAEEAKQASIEKELLKPVPKGKNVRRYSTKWEDEFVLFPHIKNKSGKMEVVDITKYPNAEKYLEKNRAELSNRKYVIQAGKNWFEIWNTRDVDWFDQDKIITPNLSSSNNFSIDFKDNKSGKYFYIDHDCYGIILKDKKRENYLYLLAILNSKLAEFFIKQKSPMFSGGYYKYHTQYLEQIPIIQSDNPIKNKAVDLVLKIISLNKELSELKDKKTSRRDELEGEISETDKEIEDLISKIYGITDAEKKIVESAI
jgi:type I restriction-modification system DNA methylase subunit